MQHEAALFLVMAPPRFPGPVCVLPAESPHMWPGTSHVTRPRRALFSVCCRPSLHNKVASHEKALHHVCLRATSHDRALLDLTSIASIARVIPGIRKHGAVVETGQQPWSIQQQVATQGKYCTHAVTGDYIAWQCRHCTVIQVPLHPHLSGGEAPVFNSILMRNSTHRFGPQSGRQRLPNRRRSG